MNAEKSLFVEANNIRQQLFLSRSDSDCKVFCLNKFLH